MTCAQWRKMLSRFVFNNLPRALRRRMQRHLRACLACAADLDLYRRTTELARQLPDVPVPPDLAERLIGAVETELRARGQVPPASALPALPPKPA